MVSSERIPWAPPGMCLESMGGSAPQPPRGSEDEPQLVGSGHRLPLLPAFPGLTFLLDFLLQSHPPNEGREMRLV